MVTREHSIKKTAGDKTESTLKSDPYMRKRLMQVFTGMQGRYTRLKIIKCLHEQPYNINQLADELGLSYKTVEHNINVLEKNNMIDGVGEKYGQIFFLSTLLENNLHVVDDIVKELEKKFNSKKVYH